MFLVNSFWRRMVGRFRFLLVLPPLIHILHMVMAYISTDSNAIKKIDKRV